jgi:L-cysteine/cystine lyase
MQAPRDPPLVVVEERREPAEALSRGTTEARAVLPGRLVVERLRVPLAEIVQPLADRVDDELVVAVERLRLPGVRAGPRRVGACSFLEQGSLVDLEEVELPSDELVEASAPPHDAKRVERGRQNPRMNFEEGRAQFPVLERYAYLQAGSVGPISRGTIDAIRAAEDLGVEEGRGSAAQFERILGEREQLRGEIGALVGVGADAVALTASTTDGCNIVLSGLGLATDDEVITTTDEHFGLLGPLHASGARVVVVEPDPYRIVAAVSPHTRLLALSHVLWTTGQLLPVHELKKETGLPILVDGAQSAGAIPVDASGLDFFTISGQKWLCGPEGTGALVVADPEMLRVARPSYLSQRSYGADGVFEPQPGARRFEPNLTPRAYAAGLRAALATRPEWGLERASQTAERFREALLDAGLDVVVPEDRATLVSWRVPVDESAAIVAALAEAGVIVRDLPGRGLVRASVGWWTSDDDLDRLVEAARA